ncbi:MAG: hypothetical protein NXI32_22460 [bacterium]|nr:hypothetical protein [bacterium]
MFELKILFFNVVIPSLIAVTAVLWAGWLKRRRSTTQGLVGDQHKTDVETQTSPSSSTLASNAALQFAAGALASSVAVWLAFATRNQFQLWSEDSWLRVPLASLLVGVVAACSAGLPRLKWLFCLLAVAAASWLVFPRGEAWTDLQKEQWFWLASIFVGCSLAWIPLSLRSAANAGVQALAWIPCVAALAFLTAQSFMRVTEPLLAVASIFGVFGIGAIWIQARQLLLGAAGPALMAMVAAGANAQFNSFLGLPNLLTAFAISAPAMAAIATQLIPGKSNQTRSTVSYIVFCLIVCVVLAAVVIVWTQMLAGGGEEEW